MISAGLSQVITGVALPIFCVRGGEELLALYVSSPPYSAVMKWEPAVRLEIVMDAWPPAISCVPMVIPPSRKVIDPVAESGETVAVKVTS